jgi:hypothetical protein
MKEIIIPKEHAVFWLDGQGNWRNRHGKFQRKAIIDHFHASIRKDDGGYYVTQINQNRREKVYFHYDDTALFVFDVQLDDPVQLVLNTGKTVTLRPRKLTIAGDQLYMQLGGERVKFAERALIAMTRLIEEKNDHYVICIRNRRYRIAGG